MGFLKKTFNHFCIFTLFFCNLYSANNLLEQQFISLITPFIRSRDLDQIVDLIEEMIELTFSHRIFYPTQLGNQGDCSAYNRS